MLYYRILLMRLLTEPIFLREESPRRKFFFKRELKKDHWSEREFLLDLPKTLRRLKFVRELVYIQIQDNNILGKEFESQEIDA